MAKTKKRAADFSAAASTRPSKKRKSAKAAMIKLGEMQDAQADLDDILDLHESADQQQDEETNHENEALAGFTTWRTTSILISGEPLTEVAKVNNRTWQFTQSVEIHHREAFTLKPLIITEGALKGHHILVLQPVPTTSAASPGHFRFLDLPPEIRAIIFDLVFAESGVIKISTHKPPHQARRPVRSSFRTAYGRPRHDWDRVRGKWMGQAPSALTILAVCKSILDEAAPIIYGNNRFEFCSTTDLGIFLDQIGNMRQHIRAVHLDDARGWAYAPSQAASVFNKLKPAKQLRTISIHEGLIRLEPPEPHRYVYYSNRKPIVNVVVSHLKSLLKVLRKAQTRGESSYSVLELVQVQSNKCFVCREHAKPEATRNKVYTNVECSSSCKASAKNSIRKTKKFRRLIAKSLGIEDETSNGAEVGADYSAKEMAGVEEEHDPLD